MVRDERQDVRSDRWFLGNCFPSMMLTKGGKALSIDHDAASCTMGCFHSGGVSVFSFSCLFKKKKCAIVVNVT